MTMRTDPLISDITVVNDLRASLYEALARRDEILNCTTKISKLETWRMGTDALERVQKFITVAQSSPCAFAYPTILYRPAIAKVQKKTGYHFSAPPLLHLTKDYSVPTQSGPVPLTIPRLDLSTQESDDAENFIAGRVASALDSRKNKVANAMFRLANPKRQHSLATAPEFISWHQSNLIALHTYAVANTKWDADPDALTPLQASLVKTRMKYAQDRPDSAYEIVPRGVAYLAAAKSKGMGLCNSPARDDMIGLFAKSTWIRLINDLRYAKAPLITEFEKELMTILADMSSSQESKLAEYCRSPVTVAHNGKPNIASIDREQIQTIVDGWETKAWRMLLRTVLIRTDLRKDKLKTLAYMARNATVRFVLTEVVRQTLLNGIFC
jgi:hypothetical protein